MRAEVSGMQKDFTLPDLQARMDLLQAGERLQVTHADVQRLFGTDDVAGDRLLWFARGHNCVAIPTTDGFTFCRRPPVAENRG
jgi:hypothetical protein